MTLLEEEKGVQGKERLRWGDKERNNTQEEAGQDHWQMPGVYNAKFGKLSRNYMSEIGSGDKSILLLKNRRTRNQSSFLD